MELNLIILVSHLTQLLCWIYFSI